MADNNIFVFNFDSRIQSDSTVDPMVLGGKGSGLAKMSQIGLPIPPGFTISTEMCKYYSEHNDYHPQLRSQIEESLSTLSKSLGKTFGGKDNGFLVSVRSGAPVSMPGMMDTVLNLGISDIYVESAKESASRYRYVLDSYRRLIHMFGSVVKGINDHFFEDIIHFYKQSNNIKYDSDLKISDLESIVNKYKAEYKKHTNTDFPQDPKVQLYEAIDAVFMSWNSERAIAYRRMNKIYNLPGTAVNICSMVFGNMNNQSGTGVAFTRNPNTGDKEVFGEFLINAQGEDIVAGIRTPDPLIKLKEISDELYNEFIDVCKILEEHYKDAQDIEFTVEDNKLYILQTRKAKRTAGAAIKIAYDMHKEGLLSKKEAILTIDAYQVSNIFAKNAVDYDKSAVIAKGLKASFGSAVGSAIFNPKKLADIDDGKSYILICNETSPEHIIAMEKAAGILTAKGGATSHAAVVTRAMGKPCIVGCESLSIVDDSSALISGNKIKEGDIVSIDANTGNVILGAIELKDPDVTNSHLSDIVQWCKELHPLDVRVNADTPAECKMALSYGASAVGLLRIEHMFFEPSKILKMRSVIIATTAEERKKHLVEMESLLIEDFYQIFNTMKGKSVTIRLMDPPLHEFLPHDLEDMQIMSDYCNKSVEQIMAITASLKESNPMLGLRGVRLGVKYPEITISQVSSIMQGAEKSFRETGIKPNLEIMIPLVMGHKEIEVESKNILSVVDHYRQYVQFKLGTMIETPRAALEIAKIAPMVDFISFGTNDLTQMTLGISRDDSYSFLSLYEEVGIIQCNPFEVIDSAVLNLVKITIDKAIEVNKDIKIGLCGEHGGDPRSISALCRETQLSYVSCSAYRVVTAIISAAQCSVQK